MDIFVTQDLFKDVQDIKNLINPVILSKGLLIGELLLKVQMRMMLPDMRMELGNGPRRPWMKA
jgi:hypothetical protein